MKRQKPLIETLKRVTKKHAGNFKIIKQYGGNFLVTMKNGNPVLHCTDPNATEN
jgi:hypothetical protein